MTAATVLPSSATPAAPTTMRYAVPAFAGAAADYLACTDLEVCLDGPAGTGKSFAALWKMHLRRILYPGSRGMVARKTLVALKLSTLVTFREQVLGDLLARGLVRYWSARSDMPAHYAYWNGSVVVPTGLDTPGRALSTEYDDILVDEALDTDVTDIETLLSRIRRPGREYGTGDRPPYAQLTLVTNPGPASHWMNRRMLAGRMTRLVSRHADNPRMTPEYLHLLETSLSGVRRQRLYLGIWASAEGTVYEDAWSPARNLVPRARYSTRPTGAGALLGACGLDPTWPRYMGIDWGHRAPMAVQWYARLPDGELVLYREIYVTQRYVEDVAREALHLMGWTLDAHGALRTTRRDADPLPRVTWGDVDPQYRETWERASGLAVTPASKGPDSIADGIQAVAARLRAGRLLVLAGSLVSRDPYLEASYQPCGFAEEIEAYVWDHRVGTPREVPRDEHDHAMDACRYVVTGLDRQPETGRSIAFHAIGW